ncbi:hypothetical protein [Shinella pollutisoli]|uniref:Uncharacterized protein n=1 Tax=Shinella pollutisoli TaxID=2250594 RepID=A0ABV7DFJ9_9HYPH|nr:hypothetical protein [Shinella pollutisoli]
MPDYTPDNRPPEERGPTVVHSRSTGTGGWAVAVIVAVLVAVGAIYFATSGPSDGIDPNANTSSIGTQDTAPAGGGTTDVQPTTPGGTADDGAAGTQQPLQTQPEGGAQ